MDIHPPPSGMSGGQELHHGVNINSSSSSGTSTLVSGRRQGSAGEYADNVSPTTLNVQTSFDDRPVPLFQISRCAALGFHVSQATKEKIWAGTYIDMALLCNDTAQAVFARTDSAHLTFAMEGDNLVLKKPNPSRKRLESFSAWQSAFHTFMSIYLDKHTHRYAQLLKYCEIIRMASVQFQGYGWRTYDEQFRLKMEIDPSRSWGEIDMELWVTVAAVPVTQSVNRTMNGQMGAPASRNMRVGHCFAFNGTQGCTLPGCRYAHTCSRCLRSGHGAMRCHMGYGASRASVYTYRAQSQQAPRPPRVPSINNSVIKGGQLDKPNLTSSGQAAQPTTHPGAKGNSFRASHSN